jgi:hypothetical protein
MNATIRTIARQITDSKNPLNERAALCKWARTTAWARQIEVLVIIIARDQTIAHASRN